MVDHFVNLAKALNPRIGDTPEQVFAWRQTVAVSLILLSFISIVHVSQANGWMSWAGIAGYVTQAQFSATQQLVKEAREDQLVQQILENTRRYCQSYDAGDQSGMSFAFAALQDARAKYFRLTHREYPQLMCSMSAQPAKAGN